MRTPGGSGSQGGSSLAPAMMMRGGKTSTSGQYNIVYGVLTIDAFKRYITT